jgi:predicted nuclease with TOPRIM domain
MEYRPAMAPADEPQGFSIDIGEILKEVTKQKRRTRRRSTSGASDMDAAIRRAIRVELADVERALRQLADEVVRLRRANEELAEKVARSLRS